MNELVGANSIVVVHGAMGVGTTTLVREGLGEAVWIDLGGVDRGTAIAEETARRLGGDDPVDGPGPEISRMLARAGATVVWDHASAAAMDIVATLGDIAPGRLVVVARTRPPQHVAALEILPLDDDAMRELVHDLDSRHRPLHEEIASIARGNPRIAELVLQAARRHVRAIASEVASHLVQDCDVGRAIAFLRDSAPAPASSIPIAAIEAFVHDGDLVRATSELVRAGAGTVAPAVIQVAAAALPALRGDPERSRQLLRELEVPPESEGDRAAAVVMSYLCEERYVRAIAAARRARRAYVAVDARRFGTLVDVAEVIALLESDRVDDARALARSASCDFAAAGPLEPLGRDVGALFQAAICGRYGDLATYLRLVEPVMASLERRGDRAPHAVAARYVARACIGLGRLDDAERYLRSAAAIGAQPGMAALLSFTDRDRAALDLARGDVEGARHRLAAALERTPANPYLQIDAWAVNAEADAVLPPACTVHDATRAYASLRGAERALRRGDHELAAREAVAAERWYASAGLRLELARAGVASAEAYLHLGDHARCSDALDRSLTLSLRHGYRLVATAASLVAAALADRTGGLTAYTSALARALEQAGPLVDDALARACRRLDLAATADPACGAPFARLVDRLGLARPAAQLVTIGGRAFVTDGQERLAQPYDLLVDLADADIEVDGVRRACPDIPLRILGCMAAAGPDGVSMERLYLDVWRGRSYEPLRHRNSIYVALQRTRALLQHLLGSDAIERISDASYRLVPSITVAIRHQGPGGMADAAACG
ncbi:MAG: hypothetical protein M3680_20175 [Myxococcota bacterium]|nr:hypothetical protein [Myxococcota bacterium]